MSDPQQDTTMTTRKIEQVSRLMVWVITLGGLGLAVAYAAVWLTPGWLDTIAAREFLKPNVEITSSPLLRALAGLVSAIPLALVLYGLWQIKHLFQLFGAGLYFTVDGSRHLLRFGAALLLAAPAGILTRAIASVLLTMQNPEGSRQLVVQAGSNDYFSVVVGGLLLVVGWVMREAARMDREIKQIV